MNPRLLSPGTLFVPVMTLASAGRIVDSMKLHDAFAIPRKAAEHHIDPRTLRRALAGEKIRGFEVAARCARAVAELRGQQTPTLTAPAEPSAAA